MSGHRGMALEALRRYDVIPRRVTFAGESFNSISRVTTGSGVYALRVGPAVQIHPESGYRPIDWSARRRRSAGISRG